MFLSFIMGAALAVPAAAADLSAADARSSLNEAAGFETQVLNGDLVRQVCRLKGSVDGACVYQCNDGLPYRVPAKGECPQTVLQDDGGFSASGRFDRPPFPFPGRDDDRWDRRPGRPGRPGGSRRPIECSAADRGWEEHWGGHTSRGYDLYNGTSEACRRCKKPTGPHGECSVTCSSPEFRCSYEFVPETGGNPTDTGFGETDEDSYDAEQSAMNRCMRNNWGRQGRCRVNRCERDDRALLRERCR